MQTTTLPFRPFNKTTEEALAPKKLLMTLHPTSKYVYFNPYAVERTGLKENDYIEFLQLGADWYFAKSVPGIGYRLRPQRARATVGLRVACKKFMDTALDGFGIKAKTALPLGIKPTSHLYNGEPVFELMRPHQSKYYAK